MKMIPTVLSHLYWLQMRVWLQIQESWVWSRSGPILSRSLIMKIFQWSFSSLPLIHSRKVVVSYKQKCVQVCESMVNHLNKLAQEKVWLGELTVPHDHSCWLERKATKQTKIEQIKFYKFIQLKCHAVKPRKFELKLFEQLANSY